MELDITSIVAALLHDVVEDTAYTLEHVKENFGDEVAVLVEEKPPLKLASNSQ